MPKQAIVSLVSVVGALVLIVAVALAVVRPWESEAPGSSAAAPLIDESTHVLDDAGADAPAVVEFFDYECPSCGRFHPIVEELRDTYEGRVTFAVRYFPLPSHSGAVPAALAAEAAAQQDEFEAMHALLLERQQEWAGSDDASVAFRGYAEDLGLDLAAYDAAVADPATLERIQLDADAGVALGVQSTPTFFVDGELVELRDFADVETAIEAALAE
ncbi:DsbA family protein [Agrococcus citreus]|uniref:Thioredoxin domain-containing protein n=1 Tax=Agrococcus citreus TaxID=84643 RepID=A0ABN1YP05_9MICO